MPKNDNQWLDPLTAQHAAWSARFAARYPAFGDTGLSLLMYVFLFNKSHNLRIKPAQISYLIEHSDLKQVDRYGQTALHLAIYYNKAQQLKLGGEQFDMLLRGSDLRQTDRDGRTALLAILIKYCFSTDHADLVPTEAQMDVLIAHSDLRACETRPRTNPVEVRPDGKQTLSLAWREDMDRRYPFTNEQIGRLIAGSDLNQMGPHASTPLIEALRGNQGRAHDLNAAQWQALVDGSDPAITLQHGSLKGMASGLLGWVKQKQSAEFCAMFEPIYCAREERLAKQGPAGAPQTHGEPSTQGVAVATDPAPESSFFGFYGIEHNTAVLETAYGLIVQWLARLGLEPGDMYFSRQGAKWWEKAFHPGHAKLQKEGFDNIKLLCISGETSHAESPWKSDAITMRYHYEEHEELSWMEISLDSRYRDVQAPELLQIMRELVDALHPEAGVAVHTGPDVESAGGRYAGDKDLQSWAECQLWREGAHGRIGHLNFLCAAQLAKPIAGPPLAQWIAAAPGRGKLSPFAGGLTLWTLDEAERALAETAIDGAKALVETESWMPTLSRLWYEQTDRLNAKTAGPGKLIAPEAIAKRNALIARIAALHDEEGSMPVVPLDDFFDGNFDEASLAPNAYEEGRPTLQKCHSLLNKVKARKDVQDVLVLIHEVPDPDEEDDNEIWPSSDTIFILASCNLADIAKATKTLGSDETNDMGVQWFSNSDETPANVPDLEPGMSVFALWWD